MHVNTGVTACLEVSGQPWMSVLAFHLVRAEILVPCNIGWASWPDSSWGFSCPRFPSCLRVCWDCRCIQVDVSSRDQNTVSHTWKRLCPLSNLPSASSLFYCIFATVWDNVTSLRIQFAFSSYLVMLNIFSFIYIWTFVHFLWRNVY